MSNPRPQGSGQATRYVTSRRSSLTAVTLVTLAITTPSIVPGCGIEIHETVDSIVQNTDPTDSAGRVDPTDSGVVDTGGVADTGGGQIIDYDYYVVADGGSDDNDGKTRATAFLTINKAREAAQAGDSVLVTAGTYREQIRFDRSGEAGKPIVFEGEVQRDGTGKVTQWLTVIDPSIAVVGTWAEDLDVGEDVYGMSNATLGVDDPTVLLTEEGEHILRAEEHDFDSTQTRDMNGGQCDSLYDSGSDTGPYLTMARDATCTTQYSEELIDWWDAPRAFWQEHDGQTYLRIGDGTDPNDLGVGLRISDADHVLSIDGEDHITVRGFHIQGATNGIDIENATGILIEENLLRTGVTQVSLGDGVSDSTFQRNKVTLNHFSTYLAAAWNGDGDSTTAPVAEHYWELHKRGVGRWQEAFDLNDVGTGNVIAYNEIFDVMAAIQVVGGGGVEIHHNDIRNSSGSAIYLGHPRGTAFTAHVHDNVVTDTHQNIRIFNPESDTLMFIYNNRFWNPEPYEPLIFFTCNDDCPVAGLGTFFVYHNSLAGAATIFNREAGSGMTILNNILSGPDAWDNFQSDWVGDFSYNWVGGNTRSLQNQGTGNIAHSGDRFWDGAKSTAPDFLVPAASEASDAGLNLNDQQYTYEDAANGLPSDARTLPGIQPGYGGGDDPDLGAIPAGGSAPPVGRY